MTQSPQSPQLPARMQHLEIDQRLGIPIPWFVARETGAPIDFRFADSSKIAVAYKRRLCWVCGGKLGAYLAFVLGPMCCINKVTSEPPSHLECARYSVQACPFLSRPRMRRSPRETGSPVAGPAGFMLDRNPGASAIWITRDYKPFGAAQGAPGVLFHLGAPRTVEWWCKGRTATRAEIMASMDSGFPVLLEIAEAEGPDAVRELRRARREAEALLPAAA